MPVSRPPRLAFLAMAAMLGGVWLPAASAASAQAATKAEMRGKAFVTRNCAACHATGRTGASRNPKAPPLRTLAARYPLENLEEAFAEGITVSHQAPEMPAFELEPDAISDMIEYLKMIGKR